MTRYGIKAKKKGKWKILPEPYICNFWTDAEKLIIDITQICTDLNVEPPPLEVVQLPPTP